MKTLDKMGTLWTMVPFFGAVRRRDVETLLRVLNDPKRRARSRRVVAFIRELHAVKSAPTRTVRDVETVLLRVADSINSKLNRARFFLELAWRGTRGVQWAVEAGRLNVINSCYVTVALLDSSGEFAKLGECATCGKWYLRSKRWQNACSERCRRKAYRQTPQWHAKNRQYVKDYYDTYFKSGRTKRKRKAARHEK